MRHKLIYVNPPRGDRIEMNKSKQQIIHRLQIAKGHLEKVISMVQKDSYCIDIVHQSIAVQAALKKTDEVILENHLRTCVASSIKKGESKTAIKEVMEVIQKK